MSVLVIAAHPDDEVLGCGGTIARLARENKDVYIAILGEGITSRYSKRDEADNSKLEELNANSNEVIQVLGAKELFKYDLPDNRFDTVPLLKVVKILENLVRKLQPTVIYTQHGGDLNIDHKITFRATLTATRPMEGHSVKKVYAYEVASSTEWSFEQFSPPFSPTTFVDIKDTLDIKIKAMKIYESEIRPFPHPRSPASLRAQALRWGSTVGREAVEAFQLIREII